MSYRLINANNITFNSDRFISYTSRAMRREGMSKDEIDKMQEEAMSGDYNNLISVCSDYLDKVINLVIENLYIEADSESEE